jgi:hypothetical protein
MVVPYHTVDVTCHSNGSLRRCGARNGVWLAVATTTTKHKNEEEQ